MSHAFDRFSALPPELLTVLRQRARELAKPLEVDEEQSGDLFEILEIHSRGQLFGIPLSVVEGIGDLNAIAGVPRAPPVLRGIVSFRGEVLFGLELSMLMGGESSGMADLRRVIVVAAGGLKAAILTEKVVSIRSARNTAFIRDKLGQHPFVTGVDSRFVTLLDPALVIQHAFKLVTNSAAGAGP